MDVLVEAEEDVDPGRLDVGVDHPDPLALDARTAATLAVVFDFPVPPRKEWTAIRMAIAPRLLAPVTRRPESADRRPAARGSGSTPISVTSAACRAPGCGRSRRTARAPAPGSRSSRSRTVRAMRENTRASWPRASVRPLTGVEQTPGRSARPPPRPPRRRTWPTCSRYSRWRSTSRILARPALIRARRRDGVERLGQVVLGPHLDAADDALHVLQGRDHDHRHVARGSGRRSSPPAPRSRRPGA